MATNNGGPAFPSDQPNIFIPTDIPEEWRNKIIQSSGQWYGMTLRQWYAGMALQGMISNTEQITVIAAKAAFELADAMIKFEQQEKENVDPK